MARLISAPAGAVFGKGLFGTLSQNTVNYLQNQIQSLANAGTEYGRAVYERSMAVFNAVNSDEANQLAEAVLSQVESLMGMDIIEPLLTVPLLQSAKPIMQGWIMTDPIMRKAWYDGKIEGYSDTYQDDQPGAIGHEHEAYRYLMNGVFVEHETQAWQYSLYADRDHNKDTMLSIRKLADIVQTQEAARMALEDGELDPTSQYGASL